MKDGNGALKPQARLDALLVVKNYILPDELDFDVTRSSLRFIVLKTVTVLTLTGPHKTSTRKSGSII